MQPSIPIRYDLTSQVFHWVTAIAVTAAFILGPGGFGRLMHQGVDPATQADIVWHESLGLLVFALTLARGAPHRTHHFHGAVDAQGLPIDALGAVGLAVGVAYFGRCRTG
jgi:cytochrome b561